MKTIIRVTAILLLFSGLAKADFPGNNNAFCPWKNDTNMINSLTSWDGLLLNSEAKKDRPENRVANNYAQKGRRSEGTAQ